MSKQRHKLFDRKTSLPNNRAERAAIEFFVIRNGRLRGWRLANQDDVAAALSIDFEANLAGRLDTLRAGDDRQFAHAATSTNSTR